MALRIHFAWDSASELHFIVRISILAAFWECLGMQLMR
jgi:hypothetical protein